MLPDNMRVTVDGCDCSEPLGNLYMDEDFGLVMGRLDQTEEMGRAREQMTELERRHAARECENVWHWPTSKGIGDTCPGCSGTLEEDL